MAAAMGTSHLPKNKRRLMKLRAPITRSAGFSLEFRMGRSGFGRSTRRLLKCLSFKQPYLSICQKVYGNPGVTLTPIHPHLPQCNQSPVAVNNEKA